jgi:hypothetical protein
MQEEIADDILRQKMPEDEELYCHKISHEKWLHEGDNNIEFFHRIANGRKFPEACN